MANILVVDDQQYVRELFSEELIDEGHQIESADNADSLMSRLQDSEHSKPDMVLLDLYLEGVKGWDLLRDIKGHDPDLPVLIVTAYDTFKDDPRLSKAEGYWVKNFVHLDRMKKKVGEILKRNGKAGPTYGICPVTRQREVNP